VAEAIRAGVASLITMGGDAESSGEAVRLAERLPGVFAAVGHQPATPASPDLARLRELARGPRVVALGEVGIDTTYPDAVPLDEQKRRLHQLCELALELDLPVSVHCRESAEPVHEVLSAHPGLRGVMHYFSGDRAWAERFLELGMHLSFAGLLTRPSQVELREVARTCPPDRLLLETDSPFGIPHGRRPPNRPAWLLDTARLVAELRGQSLAALAELESANARSLFRGAVC
jgi:TatD DNase family protein